MTQRAITVLAPLPANRKQEAAEGIRAIDLAEAPNPQPHYMSASVITDAADVNRCYVLFELNIDGRTERFLRDFAQHNAAFLDALFHHCEDYDDSERYRFLIRHTQKHMTFHRGTPGRTVQQIEQEEQLLTRAKQQAQTRRRYHPARSNLWCDIRQRLNNDREFIDNAPSRPKRVRWNLFSRGARETLGTFLTLVAKALLYVAGLAMAFFYTKELWHFGLVVVIPALVMLTRLGLDLYESPRHTNSRYTLIVFVRILGKSLGGGLAVAAFMGIVVGAIEIGWTGIWPGVAWALSAILALITLLALLVIGYLAGGWLGFSIGMAVALAVIAGSLNSLDHNTSTFYLLIALGVLALTLLVVGNIVLVLIRIKEALDEVKDDDVPVEHLREVTAHEGSRSHLISVTAIKEGPLRLWVLKIVLRTIHVGSYFIYNKGFLAGIASIHFARFVILPENRSLLFLSNYDGSFDGYLTEFKNSSGVTAVWGNTIGFPRPFLLLFDGARDEHRFKRYARNSQAPTLFWYKAYPDLSIRQIDDASLIRRALKRDAVEGTQGYWLTWKNLVQARLSESALADAIRRLG